MAKEILEKIENIIHREEENEGMIYNPDTNTICILNDTANFIWKHIDGKNSSEDIIEKIKRFYKNISDDKSLEKDIKDFFLKLKDTHMVRII